MILYTLEWWFLPTANWPFSFHSDTFVLPNHSNFIFQHFSGASVCVIRVLTHSALCEKTLVKSHLKLDLHSLYFFNLFFSVCFCTFSSFFLLLFRLFLWHKKWLIISKTHVNTMHTFVITTLSLSYKKRAFLCYVF